MKNKLYPLLFSPAYMPYIWGGRRIPKLYNRDVKMDICAESWEVSDRPEGMSVVSNGPMAGTSLHDLVQKYRDKLLGTRALMGSENTPLAFPLLIKIIDAKQRLSLQVHPNDDNASLTGGEPKTEMWYILGADTGASIFAGLKPSVDKKQFEAAIKSSQLEELLNVIPAEEGQAIYVSGGRVHAIGAGCLLLEIQQNSNTTYRVYDWGRVGNDGKPRELHIAQALQVIDWEDRPPLPSPPHPLNQSDFEKAFLIMESPSFRVTRHDLTGPVSVTNDGGSFHVLFLASGSLNVDASEIGIALTAGTSCLLPAAISEYSLTPSAQDTSVIRITL